VQHWVKKNQYSKGKFMHKKLSELIKKTDKPVTKKDILDGLKALGLHSTSKVEVHASLTSFGFVVNKVYDVIDALMEVIDKGVILMPAHTSEMTNPRDWENPPVPKDWHEIIENNRKPFDLDVFVPERIGEIPKVFFNYPGVQRTIHPEVSLSVYNQTDDPHWLDHSLDDRDLIHPLYKLTQEEGKILMMGTDFMTCTSIHLSEFMCEGATLETQDYQIVFDGEIIKKTVTTKYFDDDDKNFIEISKRYIEKYQNTSDYKQVQVGLATLTLIDAKKLFDIAKAYHIQYQKH
jgi:aminoglycoside 3-N-acetyltransferase